MEMGDILTIFQRLLNYLFFRQIRANRYFDKLLSCVEGMTDDFLTILLNLMSLVLMIDPQFRRNIEGFEAEYVFQDRAGLVYVVADFKKDKLTVRQSPASNPKLILTFKDGGSLFKLLMSESPDILDAVLNQEVDFTGNMNYLNKFAYMAMSLRLMAASSISG